MKNKLGEIAEGWINNLTPANLLDERIKTIANTRMEICNNCEYISTRHKTLRPDVHCTDCGCPLAAKTKSLQSECPKGFWGSEKLE